MGLSLSLVGDKPLENRVRAASEILQQLPAFYDFMRYLVSHAGTVVLSQLFMVPGGL